MQTSGQCACGNVTFRVDGEPLVQLYCHCRSCQLAHAAPLVAAAIFPASCVSYEGTTRKIRVTDKDYAAQRIICTGCGTKIINEPPPPVRAIHPMLCASADWFRPSMHVQWQDRSIELRDDLPKYLDYPKELGGSGALAQHEGA